MHEGETDESVFPKQSSTDMRSQLKVSDVLVLKFCQYEILKSIT